VYIISALCLRGLFSSRTPMEHNTHPTFETTYLEVKTEINIEVFVIVNDSLLRQQLLFLPS
jgi:hypothetical protein